MCNKYSPSSISRITDLALEEVNKFVNRRLDNTYIPTNNGITYLMCIKDAFSKEWYGYNYNIRSSS